MKVSEKVNDAMKVRFNKKTNLKEIVEAIEETTDPRELATIVNDIHPAVKILSTTLEAAKKNLRTIVLTRFQTQLKGKKVPKGPFEMRDNDHIIDFNDTSVVVAARETVVPHDDAADWLEKNKPELVALLGKYRTECTDTEQLYAAVRELENEKPRKALRLLKEITKRVYVFDPKKVEQAIKDKLLTVKEVETHLFSITTSFAVTVEKRDAEEEA